MKKTAKFWVCTIATITLLVTNIQPALSWPWQQEIYLGTLGLNEISSYYSSQGVEQFLPTNHPGDNVLCQYWYGESYPDKEIYGRPTNQILIFRQTPNTDCFYRE